MSVPAKLWVPFVLPIRLNPRLLTEPKISCVNPLFSAKMVWPRLTVPLVSSPPPLPSGSALF